MTGRVLGNIFRIIVLILLQVLVANKINLLDGMLLPYIYIFGLLMLPFETPRILVLAIGFASGLIMDSFTNTLGMHTAACVFLAFIQPIVAQAMAPREGYEFGDQPTIQSMGLVWYLIYAGILTLGHHLVLFFVELFRFSPFFLTIGKAILSSAGTLLLMLLGQYLIFKPIKSSRR